MKHWKFVALAGGVFVFSLFLVLQAKEVGASLVVTPTRLVNLTEDSDLLDRRIQLVGRIAEEGLRYETEPRLRLSFRVVDRDAPENSVPVVYNGLKPDMFAPDREVIISGVFDGEQVQAYTLQTQCPSKYEAPDAETIASQYLEAKKSEEARKGGY